jgi:hypothetical protein
MDANAYQSGATKWGHGINPVHSFGGDPYGGRSDKAPHTAVGPDGGGGQSIDVAITDPGTFTDYGYLDEDFASVMWGYGPDTGTSDRPGAYTRTEEWRLDTDDYPSWGPKEGGIPGGNYIRAEIHGAPASSGTKTGDKEETVGEGWVNKDTGTVEDSTISDPSQYERQTSMQQRDQVRAGSQNPNTGTASEYEAPIGSYRETWGQRIKPWSGGRRHYDMMPRAQDMLIRPFWNRTAGTGYVEYMASNEATNYMHPALQRQPVPDPYAGVLIPRPGNVFEEESYPVQDYVNVWW